MRHFLAPPAPALFPTPIILEIPAPYHHQISGNFPHSNTRLRLLAKRRPVIMQGRGLQGMTQSHFPNPAGLACGGK